MICGTIKFNKQIYSFIIYMLIEKKQRYSNTILNIYQTM